MPCSGGTMFNSKALGSLGELIIHVLGDMLTHVLNVGELWDPVFSTRFSWCFHQWPCWPGTDSLELAIPFLWPAYVSGFFSGIPRKYGLNHMVLPVATFQLQISVADHRFLSSHWRFTTDFNGHRFVVADLDGHVIFFMGFTLQQINIDPGR